MCQAELHIAATSLSFVCERVHLPVHLPVLDLIKSLLRNHCLLTSNIETNILYMPA